ncbi:hypothetical protein LY01_01586 [Nonlabens xylanidelens]|uniref:Uncharacterized protein n=1 Tax=Nonlabens xylanidelens TaxID=191564 RepID=A0A2S6IKS6_9FLAO|nr:hypothetical protein [Nonlabens xylanidelens]PPK94833.1 hypothetical protein LY01_01586 [Nonlabens xylanidelens]PQJ17389.1 hypothetical protein BST94_10015 [Nonlabens xylanidelens]
MKNLPALLFLCVLILTSCKTDTKTSIEESKQFDYTSYLLSHNDSVPTLEIEFDQPDSLFFEELNKKILPNGCETFKDFNLKIDSLTIGARLNQPCGIPMFCGVRMNVQILINQENIIFIDSENLEDFSNIELKTNEIIRDNSNLYSYKNKTGIIIIRDKKADPILSKLILASFVNSYTRYMDSLSVNNYSKHLEELNLKELDNLKKERTLVLDYWNYPEPSLPKLKY